MSVAGAIRTGERLLGASVAGALRTIASLVTGGDDDAAALPPGVARRLARDAATIRAQIETLAATPGIGAALDDAALLSRSLGERIVALVELVDTLVDEAERRQGTASGRGAYKRRQVKAALLYAAQRGGYDIPFAPSFLEPALFSIGADVAIDFVVAQVNQNALWTDGGIPDHPATLRDRLAGPVLSAIRWLFAPLSRMLAGIAWRLVLAANRLSPGLRPLVDRLVVRDARAVRAAARLRDILLANPGAVKALAVLFGAVTQQTEVLTQLTGEQKRAYAQAVVVTVLRQEGLVGASPLLDRLIAAAVGVAIDATVALFNRRRLFR